MIAKLMINDIEVVLGHKALAEVVWWLEDSGGGK